MAKTERPPTFGELIDEVQKAPDPFGKPPPTDIANPFAMALPQGERFIDTSKERFRAEPGVVYEHHSEVFNLCNREERQAHDELQQEIANAKDHYLVTKERHWTKEGDCLCLVEYVITKPNKKYEEARRRGEDHTDEEN